MHGPGGNREEAVVQCMVQVVVRKTQPFKLYVQAVVGKKLLYNRVQVVFRLFMVQTVTIASDADDGATLLASLMLRRNPCL